MIVVPPLQTFNIKAKKHRGSAEISDDVKQAYLKLNNYVKAIKDEDVKPEIRFMGQML